MEINGNIGNHPVSGVSNAQELKRPSVMIGSHTVQLGKAAPIRLDDIGHHHIRPLGIRAKKRESRAGNRMARQTTEALDCLRRQNGVLDAGKLLKALNTFQLLLEKQVATGLVKNPTMANVRGMTSAVSRLTNSQLTSVYATLLSSEMADLLEAMEYEASLPDGAIREMRAALSNLQDLEGLIVVEVSRRVAVATLPAKDCAKLHTLVEQYGREDQKPEGLVASRDSATYADLQAPGMSDLVSHLAISERTALTQSQAKYDKVAAIHGMSPLQVRELGDALREADVTINLDPDILFGNDFSTGKLPVEDPSFSLKNTFHLVEEGKELRGKGYVRVREDAENQMFPSLNGRLQGKDRPIYGALNVEQKLGGAAGGYGKGMLVLKPELKQTATFTFGDSLHVPIITFDQGGKGAFLKILDERGAELEPATVQALKDPNSELNKAVDALFAKDKEVHLNQLRDIGNYRRMRAALQVKGDGGESALRDVFLSDCILRSCGNAEKNFRLMASYDHVESLLPGLSDENILLLDIMKRRGHGCPSIEGAPYIEAQLARPVNVGRDVAEIRFAADRYSPSKLRKIQHWARKNGVIIRMYDKMDLLKTDNIIKHQHDKDLQDVKHIHGKVVEGRIRALDAQYGLEGPRLQELVDAHPNAERIRELAGNSPFFRWEFAFWYNHAKRNLVSKVLETSQRSNTGSANDASLGDALEKLLRERVDLKCSLLGHLDTMSLKDVQEQKLMADWILGTYQTTTAQEVSINYQNMQCVRQAMKSILEGDKQDAVTVNKTLLDALTTCLDRLRPLVQATGEAERYHELSNSIGDFAILAGSCLMSMMEQDEAVRAKVEAWLNGQAFQDLTTALEALENASTTSPDQAENEAIHSALLYQSFLHHFIFKLTSEHADVNLKQTPFVRMGSISQETRRHTFDLLGAVKDVVDRKWPPAVQAAEKAEEGSKGQTVNQKA